MTDERFWLNCPRCAQLMEYKSENPARPFCSMSCKNADLLLWADEGYKIAGKSVAKEPGTDLDEAEDESPDDEY